MNKILVINAGSSSLKFKLYNDDLTTICEGIVEKIGLKDSIFAVKYNGQKTEIIGDMENHKVAVSKMLEQLMALDIIVNMTEITQIGHRVVQGGELFTKSTLIDQTVLQSIRDLSDLAPLHNPAHAMAIEVFMDLLPSAKNVAVFDTQFHLTLPETSFIYPVPFN